MIPSVLIVISAIIAAGTGTPGPPCAGGGLATFITNIVIL